VATLAKQQIIPQGITPTFTAATAGGDKVMPGMTTFIEVKNASGASINVTLDDTLSTGPSGASQFNADVVVAVPATTGDKMIGPIDPARFSAVADGLCPIAYSAAASVTVGAFFI
jgi:hypothetical protein